MFVERLLLYKFWIFRTIFTNKEIGAMISKLELCIMDWTSDYWFLSLFRNKNNTQLSLFLFSLLLNRPQKPFRRIITDNDGVLIGITLCCFVPAPWAVEDITINCMNVTWLSSSKSIEVIARSQKWLKIYITKWASYFQKQKIIHCRIDYRSSMVRAVIGFIHIKHFISFSSKIYM